MLWAIIIRPFIGMYYNTFFGGVGLAANGTITVVVFICGAETLVE